MHWRDSRPNSISAIFNQLPCLGVYTTSKRAISRRASEGSNASYSGDFADLGAGYLANLILVRHAAALDANECVLRLSMNSVTRSARG